MKFTVFYGRQIYGEYEEWGILRNLLKEMPEGIYLYENHQIRGVTGWYLKDLTPVLDADVPPYLKHLQLVLSL